MGLGLKLAKVGKAKKRAFYGNVAAATAPAASEKDVLELKLKLQQQSQQLEKLQAELLATTEKYEVACVQKEQYKTKIHCLQKKLIRRDKKIDQLEEVAPRPTKRRKTKVAMGEQLGRSQFYATQAAVQQEVSMQVAKLFPDQETVDKIVDGCMDAVKSERKLAMAPDVPEPPPVVKLKTDEVKVKLDAQLSVMRALRVKLSTNLSRTSYRLLAAIAKKQPLPRYHRLEQVEQELVKEATKVSHKASSEVWVRR